MIGLWVRVPIACFRRGQAREFIETDPIPPPATVYGFLLSLIGEVDRHRHKGCRICPVLLNKPERSVVLRTMWRVKEKNLGAGENSRPDYQQLLSPVELVIWLDSSEEPNDHSLEHRVKTALINPSMIDRFGGLSLGESTHMVDEVKLFDGDSTLNGKAFLLADKGRMTLPVWVDHVGSAGTQYVIGNMESCPLTPPQLSRMPSISSSNDSIHHHEPTKS